MPSESATFCSSPSTSSTAPGASGRTAGAGESAAGASAGSASASSRAGGSSPSRGESGSDCPAAVPARPRQKANAREPIELLMAPPLTTTLGDLLEPDESHPGYIG